MTILIHNIIKSNKAKTIEQATAIVQQFRHASRSGHIELNFNEITWTTSMFVDRLVKAISTHYGHNFEKHITVTGVGTENSMFPILWRSALDKFSSQVYHEA